MRAVADTNVYISALNFGGTAEDVLALARARALTLIVSPSILEEIEGVLIRKFRWSTRRAREAIELVGEFTRLVHPTTSVLECGLAGHAEVIISGDTHLRQLRTFRGIPIVGPREFLDRHRQ